MDEDPNGCFTFVSCDGTIGSTGSQGTGSTTGDGFDCGPSNAVCNDGQHCMPFGGGQSGVPQYLACACTQEDQQSGMPDSCREANDVPGGNGLVVCDATTYDCRAPRDHEQIFDYATTDDQACAPNFTYVHVANPLPDGGLYPDLPDGGFQLLCVERCSLDGGQTCSANWTHCVAGALTESYPDGGQGSVDGCLENDCGPGVDAGAYYAACDADGTVGSCQPQPNAAGTDYLGICFKTGSAALGQACSGRYGLATDAGLLCGANALCISDGLAPTSQLPSAICLQSCDAAQLTPGLPACQPINNNPTSCARFPGDPNGVSLQAGYCN